MFVVFSDDFNSFAHLTPLLLSF